MKKIIFGETVEFYPIDKEFWGDFGRRTGCTDLTGFESFFLKKVGDAIRPKDSEYFWNNNSYCWWVREYDEKGNPVKDHEYEVWLDKNGNCIFEDEENLYRILF